MLRNLSYQPLELSLCFCLWRGAFAEWKRRSGFGHMGVEPKIGGKTPKMDGLFHGKPVIKISDLGVYTVYPYFWKHPYLFCWPNRVFWYQKYAKWCVNAFFFQKMKEWWLDKENPETRMISVLEGLSNCYSCFSFLKKKIWTQSAVCPKVLGSKRPPKEKEVTRVMLLPKQQRCWGMLGNALVVWLLFPTLCTFSSWIFDV